MIFIHFYKKICPSLHKKLNIYFLLKRIYLNYTVFDLTEFSSCMTKTFTVCVS